MIMICGDIERYVHIVFSEYGRVEGNKTSNKRFK